MTLLAEHNNPFPLFLEQYIPFSDDAVPLNVHISALSQNPGAFRQQHGVYFTVTNFHNFCSPFSLCQKITPSIGFYDWSPRAMPGTPASKYVNKELYVYLIFLNLFLQEFLVPSLNIILTALF
jgi:hypothetical protein